MFEKNFSHPKYLRRTFSTLTMEKYTAELITPKKVMKAKNGGVTHENKQRNCIQSLLNQYTSNYPEEFNRWIGDQWMIRKEFKVFFPEEYARIFVMISKEIEWTYDVQKRCQHGILSHSAMNNAIKAVFA